MTDIIRMKRFIETASSAASFVFASVLVCAAGQYGPGVSDTEIKIGNATPYSGPASAFGATAKSYSSFR